MFVTHFTQREIIRFFKIFGKYSKLSEIGSFDFYVFFGILVLNFLDDVLMPLHNFDKRRALLRHRERD